MVIVYFVCRLQAKAAAKQEKIKQKQEKAIEKLKMKL